MVARVALLGIGLLAILVASMWTKHEPEYVAAAVVHQRRSEPTPSRRDASLQRQQDLVDELRFEIEVLKEDIRQEGEFAKQLKERPTMDITGIRPDTDGRLARCIASAQACDPQITEPTLRALFQTDVLDVLPGLQKVHAANRTR